MWAVIYVEVMGSTHKEETFSQEKIRRCFFAEVRSKMPWDDVVWAKEGWCGRRTHDKDIEAPDDEEQPAGDLRKEVAEVGEHLSADSVVSISSYTPFSDLVESGQMLLWHRKWTHSASNTPRQPRPCAGPRIGRKSSNRRFGIPISERVSSMHSKTGYRQLKPPGWTSFEKAARSAFWGPPTKIRLRMLQNGPPVWSGTVEYST